MTFHNIALNCIVWNVNLDKTEAVTNTDSFVMWDGPCMPLTKSTTAVVNICL